VAGDRAIRYALLHAGARSLVVSLWPVEDRITADLMVEFHRRQATTRPATALRDAAALVREAEPHTWHWGSFLFIGS
jgi:CHAT domain-containing protein